MMRGGQIAVVAVGVALILFGLLLQFRPDLVSHLLLPQTLVPALALALCAGTALLAPLARSSR